MLGRLGFLGDLKLRAASDTTARFFCGVSLVSTDNLETSKAIARFRHSSLPEELLQELVSASLVVRYTRDTRLFLRGTPADNLMLIISGVVKIYCPHPASRHVMGALAGPGEVIGYADFIDSKERSCMAFEAQALTNCSVALISRQRIERELARLDPKVLISVLASANTFWTSMLYRSIALMGMSFRERLEAVIAEVAGKFGVKDARGTLLTVELAHDDWAALIASSRSLASKLIGEMAEEGLLERNGKRYTVLDDSIINTARNGRTEYPRPTASENGNGSRPADRVWLSGTTLSAAVPSSGTGSKRIA
jgi:CRP/FNR family transcriptional regulator